MVRRKLGAACRRSQCGSRRGRGFGGGRRRRSGDTAWSRNWRRCWGQCGGRDAPRRERGTGGIVGMFPIFSAAPAPSLENNPAYGGDDNCNNTGLQRRLRTQQLNKSTRRRRLRWRRGLISGGEGREETETERISGGHRPASDEAADDIANEEVK